MKIERTIPQFEPITITLESQEEVNALFNMAVLSREHEDAEDVGLTDYCAKVAGALEEHITTVEEEEEEVTSYDPDDDDPGIQ